MNKKIHKKIGVRSQLRNKSPKRGSAGDRKAQNKKRDMCLNLEKERKSYFSSLNNICVADNREFWKTIKSSFSEKSNNFKSVTLVENDRTAFHNIKKANALIM